MITVEKLKSFGADTEDGIARCLDNEGFYLMLVQSAVTDEQISALEKQITEKKLDSAFETAHALKGVYANLSLTPLYEIICEITEHLRSRDDIDYTPLTSKLDSSMNQLIALSC